MGLPRSLTPEQEKAVVRAYGKNVLTKDLAAKYGVHPDTIRNTLRRYGVQLRSPGGLPGALRR